MSVRPVRDADESDRRAVWICGVARAKGRERGLLSRPGVLSFLHEFLVELFRERPALAVELLRACSGLRLDGAAVRLASVDLTQVVPAAYRTDAIPVVRDANGRDLAAVIAEIQLCRDEDKRRTWPVYVTAARASLRCPVTLLVLAPEPDVARWASQPIELGHPGFTLRPIVIGYGQIPRVADEGAARAAPELAVLSAMAHRDLESAELARAGISGLPEDKERLYWDVIVSSLPALVRQALEVRMIKGYEYQSDFARKYYSHGIEKGREEGLRSAIVEIVCARLPGLREELEARLRGEPEARLRLIAGELGKARDEDEVRAVLDRPPSS